MNRDYCVIIDNGGNVYKIRVQAMLKCFDDIIAPLDIINQVSNNNEMEIAHEIDLGYIKQLENGLIKALDELSQAKADFNYYDKLRELTDFSDSQVLDFLNMFNKEVAKVNKQLTMQDILDLALKLKGQGVDLSKLRVYLGNDDELNGVHCGWYCELVENNGSEEDNMVIDLINENFGNIKVKDEQFILIS